jgi:hypothetical protein
LTKNNITYTLNQKHTNNDSKIRDYYRYYAWPKSQFMYNVSVVVIN